MKTQDLFGLAVRILGLIFLYEALVALPACIGAVTSGAVENAVGGIVLVAGAFVVAYWLIRNADWVVRLSYPESDERRPGKAD